MSPGSPTARPALLALCVLLAGVALAGVAIGADAAASAQQSTQVNDTGLGEGPTVIEIDLQGDGDARISVTQRFNVSTDARQAAFEVLATDFEAGRGPQLGLSSFRTALEQVRPTVDRSMTIQDVTRTTVADNGTLRMSFTWTNFARAQNDTFVVDDVFTTPNGTWLNGINQGQVLVIDLPGGGALDAPKRPENGRIRWEGPVQFERGEMEITYTASGNGFPFVLAGIGLVGLGALAAVVLFAVRMWDLSLPSSLPRPSLPTGGADADDADESLDDAPRPPQTPGPDVTQESDAGDDDGVDLELLSDEERVEYLLEQNGGRMKQANIVKETGWSNAKVSQLLSGMAEEGRIAKLRIGRENLISFPDEDVGEFEDS